MHLQIKNLGQIKQANIHVNDLTIICGPNGSNKTWLSYAIYHHLAFPKISNIIVGWKIEQNEPLDNGTVVINMHDASFLNQLIGHFEVYDRHSASELARTFNVNESFFTETTINQIVKDKPIEQSLAYLNAVAFQQNLIESSFKIEHKAIHVISEKDDPELQITLTDGNYSSEKVAFAFGVALRTRLNEFQFAHRPFAITSERVGCLAFQKDIDGTALRIKDTIDEILEEQQFIDNLQLEQFITRIQAQIFGNRSNLASPVRANLRAVRDAEQELKKQSFLQHTHPEINQALRAITQGSFSSNNGVLQYQFGENQHVPMTVASSSIKSLFHLDLYINNLAKEGDVLLIDEPELNLHPDNQRKMAKVLARLTNAGIKVLITTHSDYLIREINNSIMLSHDVEDKQAIMARNQIQPCDLLSSTQVSAYSIDIEGKINTLEVNQMGIDTQIFDTIIDQSNQLQNEIYYHLNDE